GPLGLGTLFPNRPTAAARKESPHVGCRSHPPSHRERPSALAGPPRRRAAPPRLRRRPAAGLRRLGPPVRSLPPAPPPTGPRGTGGARLPRLLGGQPGVVSRGRGRGPGRPHLPLCGGPGAAPRGHGPAGRRTAVVLRPAARPGRRRRAPLPRPAP